MNILVTGSAGFMGKNFVAALKNIRDAKDRTRENLIIHEIYEYDLHTSAEELSYFCRKADFVFNFAGINRPKETSEFMTGNYMFPCHLLQELEKWNNKCPIMYASSIQATLHGRFAGSEYGKSKLAAEELLFAYAKKTGARVLVYRIPNMFGKWCRPNYNSVIATFCNNIANDLPIQINDASVELDLVYIDDLIQEMFDAMEGKEHRCEWSEFKMTEDADGKYCFVPAVYHATLGNIVGLLEQFRKQTDTLVMPEIASGSFAKKLYSTYLSYLPKEKAVYALRMNTDERGSFTELLKTDKCGQVSVNISKPGITKGQHWHNSKWEIFFVVAGHGLIEERKIGSDEVIRYEVSGEKIEVIQMLPGYTHNIINLSETEDLVTVMWANEQFDPVHPDTFSENV